MVEKFNDRGNSKRIPLLFPFLNPQWWSCYSSGIPKGHKELVLLKVLQIPQLFKIIPALIVMIPNLNTL
jgi:hypothetical protein